MVRKLRDMLPQLVEQRKTLLAIGPNDEVPVELIKEVTTLELPLPGIEEMRTELHRAIAERGDAAPEMTPAHEEHLLKAVLGLTGQEARKAFARALQGVEKVSDDVYAALVAEKRHMVQGSDLLEFFDLEEGIGDIGGLDGLKEWIQQRAEAFSVDAQSRGISNPKGVLLAGVQGCGKSLSAKAIARLLGFPLVRMDMSNLLEQQRGSSEQNLREVLHLMETIAPSVLWLEEIDKAFAGLPGGGGERRHDGPHHGAVPDLAPGAHGPGVRRRHGQQHLQAAAGTVASRPLRRAVLRRPAELRRAQGDLPDSPAKAGLEGGQVRPGGTVDRHRRVQRGRRSSRSSTRRSSSPTAASG